MRLLFITTGYLPMPSYKGGAVNTLLQEYLNSNQKDNIVVYSIGDKDEKDFIDKNIEYRYIHHNFVYKINTLLIGMLNKIPFVNIRRYYIYKVIKSLKKKNELSNYNYIILENTPKSVPYISRETSSRVILHMHNDYLNINTKYGKKIIDKCYKIICVSSFIKSRVDKIKPNNKTYVLYNGIDLKRFNNKYNKRDLRKKYELDSNKKIILYVGRLLEKKGIFELINAFNAINDKNTILLIVGNGTQKIKNRINNLVEKNNRIILMNYIDNSKISEIYSLADIGVVPSKCNEAFGLTVIEGLACNLRMIVSNDGAIPEVASGHDVEIIDKDNLYEELVTTLNKLLKNSDHKSNNLEFLQKKYSIKSHVKKFNEIINN